MQHIGEVGSLTSNCRAHVCQAVRTLASTRPHPEQSDRSPMSKRRQPRSRTAPHPRRRIGHRRPQSRLLDLRSRSPSLPCQSCRRIYWSVISMAVATICIPSPRPSASLCATGWSNSSFTPVPKSDPAPKTVSLSPTREVVAENHASTWSSEKWCI